MTRIQKLYNKILNSPENVRFNDLCKLAQKVGFVHRNTKGKGSHETYSHPDIRRILNFQRDKNDKSKAKPYQVRQLLDIIEEHDLMAEKKESNNLKEKGNV